MWKCTVVSPWGGTPIGAPRTSRPATPARSANRGQDGRGEQPTPNDVGRPVSRLNHERRTHDTARNRADKPEPPTRGRQGDENRQAQAE